MGSWAAAPAAAPPRAPRRGRVRAPAAVLAVAAIASAGALSGCYAPQLELLRTGLDSLRTVVDTLQVRDAAEYQLLVDMRREVSEQRDILLSTRATAGSTTQEMFDQMSRLESKLDEVMGRFTKITERAPVAVEPGDVDPGQLYDQAQQDLTQGRYTMALQNFRDFVRRFPSSDLADNAQYGAGECFFAQSQFDSAAVAYARVEADYPQGDKIPSALYKLALCQEKLGRSAQSRLTLEDLVKRFPLSGEAQLARERLASSKSR